MAHTRLHGDHRHVMRNHVMKFARNAGAFLQQRPPAALGLTDGLLFGEPALRVIPLA
jgi:hypothetical protein